MMPTRSSLGIRFGKFWVWCKILVPWSGPHAALEPPSSSRLSWVPLNSQENTTLTADPNTERTW